MPTADEPALASAPAWSMSTGELEKTADLLGVVECPEREKLHAAIAAAAGCYLRWTKQERATPPLTQQKEQLTKVKNAAGRLVTEVEKLTRNPDAEFAFLYQLQRSRDGEISNAAGFAMSMTIDDVLDLVAWLRDGASGGPSFLDSRSGPKSRPSLCLFVLSLCSLYEQITGKSATHNPYLKTKYTGSPYSAAGRFVEFIVRLVDPQVTPMQISTAMGHVVPDLRSRRTQEAT